MSEANSSRLKRLAEQTLNQLVLHVLLLDTSVPEQRSDIYVQEHLQK
jgi:hypothetical protein